MQSHSERSKFHIQNILQNDPKMTQCSYAGFGWSDSQIVELCEALKKNDYITEIDLSYNEAGKNAAAALTALPNLKQLDLRANALHDAGVLALSHSKSLEWLSVQDNGITDTGMKHLADNTHCYMIFTDFNRFASPESIARVKAACAYNRLIRDQKLSTPSRTSAIQESPEDREKYIEEHWKEYYKDPKSTIPNLGSVLHCAFVFDPNVREEIFPVENPYLLETKSFT